MSLFLVAARAVKRFNRYRVGALLALAAAIVFIGAALFAIFEDVSYGTGLYWSITTATTVGYGDVTPHNTAGRIIAIGVMLTTIPIVGAVFALVAGASVMAHMRRLLGMDASLPKQPYILVFGTHPVLPGVLAELGRGEDPIVLVAPEKPAGVGDDVKFLAGDPSSDEMVRRSNPAAACRALIACTEDSDTLVVAVAIHSLAPELEVYALTQSPRVAAALHQLGVTHTLASDELVGHTLAKSLETPQAGSLLLQMVDSSSYRLHEAPVDDALVSQPLSKARMETGRLVLGIVCPDGVKLGIDEDPILAAGDRLIVLEGLE